MSGLLKFIEELLLEPVVLIGILVCIGYILSKKM